MVLGLTYAHTHGMLFIQLVLLTAIVPMNATARASFVSVGMCFRTRLVIAISPGITQYHLEGFSAFCTPMSACSS